MLRVSPRLWARFLISDDSFGEMLSDPHRHGLAISDAVEKAALEVQSYELYAPIYNLLLKPCV